MAPPVLGSVEVQKDGDSRVWYCGHILEAVNEDTLLVGFEHDVWPKAQFPASRVRKPPKHNTADLDKFSPRIGEEVELRVPSTDHAPASWATAVVRNIKHGFYFVARTAATAEGAAEAIVEKDQLRPPTPAGGLPGSSLRQDTYKLPSNVQHWASTADAAGCFSHIEEQSQLVHIQVVKAGLKLIGDERAIQRAKMLLDVHVKHQTQIQNFQDMREKRLKVLEARRNRIEGTGYKHSVEIVVDPSFIARIIGKGGEAIRALQEKYDVSIRIIDGDTDDQDRIVRIFGNTQESVEQARADVEFVEEVLPVEPHMYSWLLGRSGRTIQGLRDSAGLVYAKLDREGQQLHLCGTRHAVQDAIAMFETHIMYYPVFHQMDEDMEQIVSQLEEYGDYNARWEWGWYRDEEDEYAQKGKGKGKGKPKGGGGKPGKGAGKGKGWDDAQLAVSPPRSKGGKGPKGGKGGKNGDYRQHEEEHEAWDDGHHIAVAVSRGKGAKGAEGKSGKGGAYWQEKYEREEEDDEEEEAELERKGGGRGRGRGRGAGGGAVRAAAAPAAASPKAQAVGEREVRPAPSGRKMGKKGMRS